MPRPAPLALTLPRALLCLALGVVSLRSAPTETDDAWTLVDRFDFNAALSVLDDEGAAKADAPAAQRLAHAAALLASQPRTPEKIATALATTRALAADPATPADTRVVALHFQGRILREHLDPRSPENLAAARAIFRELAESGSTHPLALRAPVTLGFGLLYDEPDRPRADRFAAAEALLPLAVRHPAVERDLRYVLSQAALVWKLDPVIAREHLRRVEEIGFSQLPRRLNVRVMLGRLADETGDLALAEKTYRAFLAESVRDARDDTIRALLADVEKRRARLPATGPR